MDTLIRDIRYAIRLLLKNPGFTAVAVLTLSLGIGANSAIFSLVDAILLRPLSYKDANRIIMIWGSSLKENQDSLPLSPSDFADFSARNQVLDEIAALATVGFNLTGRDEPVRVQGFRVSSSLFQLLGITPIQGRSFLPEEERPGSANVVILSNALWRNRYGSDPGIIGKSITLNNESYDVIGILPADFHSPFMRADIWVPLGFDPRRSSRGERFLKVIARIKPSLTLQQAQMDIDAIARDLEQQYPRTNKGRGVRLVTLQQHIVRQSRSALLMLVGAVGFVLLIACANVANLLLVRGSLRQKEFSIRCALGAQRWQLIRQLLCECLILSLASGTLGVLLAHWGVTLLASAIPEHITDYIPSLKELSVNERVVAITFLISMLTSLLFGLIPSLRSSAPNLNENLKDYNSTSADSRNTRLQGLFVTSEIAFALALLIGAGLMMKSFLTLMAVDPGFDTKNLITMQLSLPSHRYSDANRCITFYQQALERIQSLPGVQSSAVISDLPLTENYSYTSFTAEEHTPTEPGINTGVRCHTVSPRAFQALGIRLLDGRYFTEEDKGGAPLVAIISLTMAQRFWPDQLPIGKRIKLSGPESQAPWVLIAGVVSDTKFSGFDLENAPEIYLPHAQHPNRSMSIIVRAYTDQNALIGNVRNEILALDKDQPVYKIKPMEQVLSDWIAPHRLLMFLLGTFAAVALTLAAVGVYGIMAYSVSQRKHEIGVRIALGAKPIDVMRLVIRQGCKLSIIGIIAGLAGAYALSSVMTSLLFAVSPTDIVTYLIVSLLLMIVVLAASYIPAHKATKLDPIIVLRQ